MRARLVLCLLAGCSSDPKEEPLGPPFGAGFEWGSATAAYQVEGGNTQADLYAWEQRCVRGPIDGKRDGDETFLDCESNLDGPNFWELYAADWDAAAAMGHNAARFGIEWAKIEPTPGVYDEDVLAHYHAVITAARDRGLEVMVTLQHFSLPLWANDCDGEDTGLGGWAGNDDDLPGGGAIVAPFVRFAGDMGEEFGPDVDLWVTINEPMVLLAGAYLAGAFPPGDTLQVGRVVRGMYNMAYAHAGAYDALHERDVGDADGDGEAASVSLAQHWRIFDPEDDRDLGDIATAERFDAVFNRAILDVVTKGTVDTNADGDVDDAGESIDPALQDRLDWLGINYYGRKLARDSLVEIDGIEVPVLYFENPDVTRPHNDLGWEIYPEGFERTLDAASGYGLPIRITENGMADADGAERPAFIVSHLKALGNAIHAGADVRGYYHWSLIDNFEWQEGYGPRFGLLHVDYDDPARGRTRTAGADAMQRIIEAGDVTSDIEEEFGTLGE